MSYNQLMKKLLKPIKVVLALTLWLFVWNRMNLEVGARIFGFDPNHNNYPSFLFKQSLYLFVVIAIASGVWRFLGRDFRFLYTDKKKLYSYYTIPLVVLLLTILVNSNKGFPFVLTQCFSFIAISFSQDFLTFGLLQSYLEETTGKVSAAIITVGAFFVGHTGFFPLNFLLVFYAVGFVLFGFLRFRQGNIYGVNAVHATFNVLRIFFM